MPLLENRIGDYTFLGISGEIEAPKQILSIEERPGVNGTEITRFGKKGRPFTVRTWVDAATYEFAVAYYDLYIALIDGDPLEIVKGGVSSLVEDYKVQVLDVRKVYVGRIVAGPGGLAPPSQGYIECEWTLLSVEV